jgi:hypothetical protein
MKRYQRSTVVSFVLIFFNVIVNGSVEYSKRQFEGVLRCGINLVKFRLRQFRRYGTGTGCIYDLS